MSNSGGGEREGETAVGQKRAQGADGEKALSKRRRVDGDSSMNGEPAGTLALELGVEEKDTTGAQEDEYAKLVAAYQRLESLCDEDGAGDKVKVIALLRALAGHESESVQLYAENVRNLLKGSEPVEAIASSALDHVESNVTEALAGGDELLTGAVREYLRAGPRIGASLTSLSSVFPRASHALGSFSSSSAGGETVAIDNDTPKWVDARRFRHALANAKREYPRGATVPPSAERFPREDNVPVYRLFSFKKLLQVGLHLTVLAVTGTGRPARKLSDFAGEGPVDDDEYFVQQRLMGVNPAAITALTPEVRELVNEGLRKNNNADPLQDGRRYFMCDYGVLEPFSRKLPSSGPYVPASVVVLELQASGKFVPAAILLDRAGEYPQAAPPGDSPQWRFAKMCARASEWNVHEIGSHLTLTHLVVEAVCLFTYRSLPQEHPIYQLLKPHFYKTLPLNGAARRTLVPDIIAKYLTAFNTAQCFAIVAAFYEEWNFSEHYVPRNLEARGVDKLPTQAYPFGTTSLLVWNHLQAYVKDVIGKIYRSRDDLQRDTLLQTWLADMAEIRGFPDISTVDELVEALTMIVYTASHQHSAVNYFQAQFLSYAPTAPSMLRMRPNFDSLDDSQLVQTLPTPTVARLTTAVVKMLSEEPEDDHRLTQFSFPNNADFARSELKDMQYALRGALAEAFVGNPPVLAMVSNETLAQSVLI